MSDGDETTVYEALGGQPFFVALAARFYERVEADPVLRPLYPADPAAFAASRDWLALFLGQYWGGPAAYSEARGHPRLRMRHARLAIGAPERDAWERAMRASVIEAEVPAELEARLLDYFAMAAQHLVNT